jgi:hypothetical protein
LDATWRWTPHVSRSLLSLLCRHQAFPPPLLPRADLLTLLGIGRQGKEGRRTPEIHPSSTASRCSGRHLLLPLIHRHCRADSLPCAAPPPRPCVGPSPLPRSGPLPLLSAAQQARSRRLGSGGGHCGAACREQASAYRGAGGQCDAE